MVTEGKIGEGTDSVKVGSTSYAKGFCFVGYKIGSVRLSS